MMHFTSKIHGEQVKDLITKFFYRDNHLCFHILLDVEDGDTIFFQEFIDYAEYKKTFSDLQKARNVNATIDIPKNNFKNITRSSKVA